MDTRTVLIDELCNRVVYHQPQDDGMDWPDGFRELRGMLDQASILTPWIHIVDEILCYILCGQNT